MRSSLPFFVVALLATACSNPAPAPDPVETTEAAPVVTTPEAPKPAVFCGVNTLDNFDVTVQGNKLIASFDVNTPVRSFNFEVIRFQATNTWETLDFFRADVKDSELGGKTGRRAFVEKFLRNDGHYQVRGRTILDSSCSPAFGEWTGFRAFGIDQDVAALLIAPALKTYNVVWGE